MRMRHDVAVGKLGPTRETEEVESVCKRAGRRGDLGENHVEGEIGTLAATLASEPLVVGMLFDTKERRHENRAVYLAIGGE